MSEPDHWFEPIADHLGAAYLRYSFTMGTRQEVEFLTEALHLEPGMRLLDVGCGPGRHALALAERGIDVVGIDISQRFVDLATGAAARASAGDRSQADAAAGADAGSVPAPGRASFRRLDARHLDYDGEFDAAISLCQGAFGLVGPGADEEVLAGMARALRPGGRAAVSAFSSYFSVKYQTDATFDAAAATATETTEVKDEAGTSKRVELHTTCYTPRELGFLAERAGFEVEGIWSVEPGAYARAAPTTESAEFLLLALLPGPVGLVPSHGPYSL